MDRATPEAMGLSSAGLDAIDAAIQAKIDDGTVAGAAMLVARHGRIVRQRFLGADHLVTGKPLTDDTIFRIFSMAKPITGTAMMILHDEGRWSPDDPIAHHLPELAGVKVYSGETAGSTPIVTEPDHAPTMAELMTHARASHTASRSGPRVIASRG